MRVMTKSHLPKEAPQILGDAYDGALFYLDAQIGHLLDELDRRGVLKNTIVIITSDHGEQFGEHGLFFHANSLYTQLLQVPLIVLGTDSVPAGVSVNAPVTLRDLPQTILALTHVQGPDPFPGRSFAGAWTPGAAPAAPEPFAAELGRKAQLIQDFAPTTEGIRALFMDGLHYIRNGTNRKTGKIREELFDLAQDPREEHDLTGSDLGQRELPRYRLVLDSLSPPNRPGAKVAPAGNP
jgi:arylsulfatase A-like enzyme